MSSQWNIRLLRNCLMTSLTQIRLIEDFQEPRETETFIEHIKAGLRLLNETPDSLLVFSGGPTKQNRSEISEARSYLDIARANKYFNIFDESEFEVRVTTEEIAVDSYQNLLFSLLRFYLAIQRWPNHISLVSHDFKKRRFVELHCPAIRWPIDKFEFVGIDPPQDVVPREHLNLMEHNKGYGLFKNDCYGAHTYLKDKRKARGWNKKQLQGLCQSGIPTTIKGLLVWEGGDTQAEVIKGPLPWDPVSLSEEVP